MKNIPIEKGRNVDSDSDGAIFESQEQLQEELSRLCYGDLYVIGKLWIHALRSVLVGANLSLIPTVKAAAKPEAEPAPPGKPPNMKYMDLPIYESPHYDYKSHLENEKIKQCPPVKILHGFLLPKVSAYKKSWIDSIKDFNKDLKELRDDACKAACQQKKEVIKYLRHPDNLKVRQAVMVTGVATGYYAAGRSSLFKKLFFTTLGALAAGSLCFPEATDEIFRDVTAKVVKFGGRMIGLICRKNISFQGDLPCELPDVPPDRPDEETNLCGKKK